MNCFCKHLAWKRMYRRLRGGSWTMQNATKYNVLTFPPDPSFHRGASARAVQPCWGQLGFPPEAQTNPINSDGAWNKWGSVWFAHVSRTALWVLKPCEKFLRRLLQRRRELSQLFHIHVLFFIDMLVLVWFGHIWTANYTEESLLKGHFFVTWNLFLQGFRSWGHLSQVRSGKHWH